MCALDCDGNLTHTCHFVKHACALRVLEVCVHIFVPTHIAACFCISLSLVLAFVYLCSLMEGQQNVQLSPGTTEWNHSYYTGNSFSAPHSAQQLQNGTIATSVQSLAYTQEANGAASSGFVSNLLLLCSAISSQVPACPTRNVTGDVMPLAEAITQLSFLEFLQRCGIPIAPLQPSQLPVPISLLDAAVQTTPPCDASQDVSTQTSDQLVSSISFDVAVQTSFPRYPHFISGCCRADDPTQYSVSARFYTDGFSPSFLVFC